MATEWKEVSTGVKERRLDSEFCHVRIHYTTDTEKDPQWVKRHSARYGGIDTPKWRREFEIDYTAVRGQRVYPMLNVPHIQKLDISKWAYYRVIDHGIRHPTVCLWIAVNRSGDRHVYREYYMTNKTIPFNVQEIMRRTGENEPIVATLIDPATRQRVPLSMKDKSPVSVLSLYNNEFGSSCTLADNSKVGYDTVRDGLLSVLARKAIREGVLEEGDRFAKEYFAEFELSTPELLSMASKPGLSFEPSCRRCYTEMRNLRFKEITGDVTQKAAPEEIMDKDDDGPDCVRYAMQTKLKWQPHRRQPQPGSHLWSIEKRRLNTRNPRYVKR